VGTDCHSTSINQGSPSLACSCPWIGLSGAVIVPASNAVALLLGTLFLAALIKGRRSKREYPGRSFFSFLFQELHYILWLFGPKTQYMRARRSSGGSIYHSMMAGTAKLFELDPASRQVGSRTDRTEWIEDDPAKKQKPLHAAERG
jgi:hypothetical protein